MAKEIFSTTIESVDSISHYGSIRFTNFESLDLYKAGINDADLVEISFAGKTLIVPVVPDFNYLDIFKPGLATFNFGSKNPTLLCNGCLFAEHFGIVKRNPNPNGSLWIPAEGISFPITFTITLKEKEGYLEEFRTFDLLRTDDREDYPECTDEQFANFREVATGNIKKRILYRGCSPFHNTIKRNAYSDKAIENHKIKTIICQNGSKEEVIDNEGATSTYSYKQNVFYIHQPVSFFSSKFNEGLLSCLRFMLSHQGPYFIHCLEGKDRTGFVIACLECLCGANMEEIKKDYMETFSNFFKVRENSKAYPIIEKRIEKLLCAAFKLASLDNADLENCAIKYYKNIGLSEEEIANLKGILEK